MKSGLKTTYHMVGCFVIKLDRGAIFVGWVVEWGMRLNSWCGATASLAMVVRGGARLRLAPSGETEDDAPDDPSRAPLKGSREDLPYKVELWDGAKTVVEQVLAVTASGSIGYAAFYAATREFPQRYITLRHKNRIVSRWNVPGH